MKPRSFLAGLAILAFSASVVFQNRAEAAPSKFTVTDLGTLGGDISYGFGINASGQVTGWSYTPGNAAIHAVRWTGTTPRDLGALGGTESYGIGINASGKIAGRYLVPNSTNFRAVRWSPSAQALDSTSQAGYAINTSGQIAGADDILANGTSHAMRWTNTSPQDLGTLGGSYSSGLGINDSGQVAGWSSLPFPNTSQVHAVRWTGTSAGDLGTLGGSSSYGYGINASGQVAGRSNVINDSAEHAVRWTGTTPTDLGTLGGVHSYGYAINAAGDVVGMSMISPTLTTAHAFLYTNGKMYDLETLLPAGSGVTEMIVSSQGNSINDQGQIAVTGRVNGGSQHALLLSPVLVVGIAITGPTKDGAILHLSAILSVSTFCDFRNSETSGSRAILVLADNWC